MKLLLALSLMLAACGGGEGGDDAPTPDTAPTGTCAIYDSCTDLSECSQGAVECHLFMQDGIQVCTQACTPGDNSTCPMDSTGANGTCNNKGICKPAAANTTSACTP